LGPLTHKVCVIRHKNCVWAAPRCVWAVPDTSWLGSQGKKEQTVPFVLSAILEDPFCERTMDMEV
jgi:hypothetical protein